MTKKFSLPRGTADILPEEVPLWLSLEARAREVLGCYNYKEIRTPVFEEAALFKRSLGQTSDVVKKQLLELVSSKEEGFALRPEGTAAVARSYIENSMDRREGVTKLFYIGPMFRGERPQKGRLRQFHQIGVEVIGPQTASPYLDAEVIALNVHLLKAFGLEQFTLKINTLGSPEDKENLSGILRRELNPQTAHLCPDCRERFDRNVFRILDCKHKECRAVVENLRLGYEYLSDAGREYYGKVKEALRGLDVAFEEVPSLVRGLDYYTHTVFEICAGSLGSQDAVSAGGRYNNLVAQLKGPEADAIGFALGMERVLLAMPPQEKLQEGGLEAYLIALDEPSLQTACRIADALRRAGIRSDVGYRISSMKSQMRLADKAGARSVVIIGEQELQKQCVTLKDMARGVQAEVMISNNDFSFLIRELKERRRETTCCGHIPAGN